jgi:hypothetical protein
MRSFLVVGATWVACGFAAYGCTTTSDDDDTNAQAGMPASGGTGGGAGASGATAGKGSGGSSTGGNAGTGEAGEGGAPTGGTTGGSTASGGKGGSAATGGTKSSGGTTSTGGTSAAGAAGEAEGGAAGAETGGTGPAPFVCTPDAPGTVTWSDGFESGGTDWSITGGVWAIGAPTKSDGPSAIEGSKVAGTVLDADYGNNENAWLISPDIDVPAAKNHPRVGLRYWYELASGDTAYIAIRASGGSWQTFSTLTGSGDGSWRNLVIPVDSFANETIEVGVQLVTNNAATAAGVFVDDFRFITGDIGLGNCENFENGYDGWSVYNGVWDIGVPTATAGPDAEEGHALGGTVLSGNYADNENAWLVSPEFAVPAASQNPRVSLSYWYDLAAGDTGYITVRPTGGSWQTFTTLTGDGTGSWRNLTIPLNSFANENVELGFQIVTNNAAEGPGMYVDDVRYETGPLPDVVAKEGFENGWDGWWAANGVWTIGKPVAPDAPAPHGGKAVAGTFLNSDYVENENAWLVSPRLVIPHTAKSPKLSYWYWYDLAAGDTVYAAIRSDGGSWQTIDTLQASADDTWRQHQADLTPYINHTIELGFQIVSNNSANGAGFFVDDVNFTIE